MNVKSYLVFFAFIELLLFNIHVPMFYNNFGETVRSYSPLIILSISQYILFDLSHLMNA